MNLDVRVMPTDEVPVLLGKDFFSTLPALEIVLYYSVVSILFIIVYQLSLSAGILFFASSYAYAYHTARRQTH